MTTMKALYDCVQKRPRPEDVAHLILEEIGDFLTANECLVLRDAARHSFKNQLHQYSSMSTDFARPTSGFVHSVKAAQSLFWNSRAHAPSAEECLDPVKMESYVRHISSVIAKTYGESKKSDKLTKAQRRQIGIFKNARWYNKRWRLLCRMEKKINALILNQKKYFFTRVSKSGLAIEIPFSEFETDSWTAYFIAYYSARMSLRSTFTNQSQERAFDTVSEMLLKRCESNLKTRWDLIAYVMPDERVLKHLTDEQKGKMLGRWWSILTEMAEMLEDIFKKSKFDRSQMVVDRGDDSTTWNQVAGGWNKAREQWISLLYAMNLDSILDIACPGKVMRLMAADVARWHRLSGGDVHPDTKIWAALPPPWEVFSGKSRCSRGQIEVACTMVGVKSESWINGRATPREAVPFKPTPELVHGVAVSSPALANALRSAGAFSGKSLKEAFSKLADKFIVHRDEHGMALQAEEEPGTR